MSVESNANSIDEMEDAEDLNEAKFSQMWLVQSGKSLNDTALGKDHEIASESVAEPADLFALLARHDDSKAASSEVPSIPSSVHTPAASSTTEDLSRCSSSHESQEGGPFSNRRGSYFGPQSTNVTDLARPLSTSTLSSTSYDGLAANRNDSKSPPQSPDTRPPVWRGHSAQTIFPISHPESNRPTSVPTAFNRRDGPGYPTYPNQSFLALQSQNYTPSYPPRPLRARNSHPSQSSLNSDSRYPSTVVSGAKTVGNTPVHSPRLFTPTMSRNRASGDESEDSHYNTPLLHHTHLQAPIETNKLLKDFDPISGRKTVNNYEFFGKLGSGAHGTVKLGKNIDTGEQVAIKIVRRFSKKVRFGKPPHNPDDMTKKEVAILKKARHPHVVSLLEVIDDDQCGKVYLVLEYVELGEIIWRKQTDKDVARFEMSRVIREKSGHFDESFEIAEIENFNAATISRRGDKAHILQEEMRGKKSKPKLQGRPRLHVRTSGEPEPEPDPDGASNPFWSLEYATESEEDLPPTFRPLPSISSRDSDNLSVESEARRRPSTASPDCSTPAQSDTPRPSHPNASDVESLKTASKVRSHSRSASLAGFQGNLFEPYVQAQRPIDKAPEASAIKRTAGLAEWTAEEEEFMHVPCLTISQALDAFRDTVLGLEYLHYQGIIHRDIKPANLLWTSDHRVKISDFGVSYLGKPIRENDQNEEIAEADGEDLDEARELAKTVGTPAFYAPELCDPRLFDSANQTERPQITGQIDVWALGVTLYGMIFGRLPFFDVNAYAMYEKIAMQEVFIPRMRLRAVEDALKEPPSGNKRPDDILEYEEVDEELRDLLKKLLEKQPSKRICLKEVKHHPWVLRGIPDITAWVDQTDPSVQSQGKKIEVSTQEVQEAVVGLRFVEMIRTGMKGIRSMVRGRDGRKRGHSNVKSSESHASTSPSTSKASTSSYEGRRSSLRGDEQIYSALRASREGSEHPLSHSVAASPDMKKRDSYFDTGNLLTVSPDDTRGEPSANRPNFLERTLSNAESTKTIRAVPASIQEIASTPAELFSPMPPLTDFNTSSGLGGIFGGAGRRFVHSMRSRERGRGRDSPSLSSRSSSIATSATEDPHGLPSVAVTTAVVAGLVDQPPVPQDYTSATDPSYYERSSSTTRAQILGESYAEAPYRDQEEYYHRRSSERSLTKVTRHPTTATASEMTQVPFSDDITYRTEPFMHLEHPEDLAFPVSSSSDHITSGMSESTSHPSIPSVVSGASSLSAHADEYHHLSHGFAKSSQATSQDSLGTGQYHHESKFAEHRAMQVGMIADDDEAGYIGEGELDSESDDEGIEMSGRRSK